MHPARDLSSVTRTPVEDGRGRRARPWTWLACYLSMGMLIAPAALADGEVRFDVPKQRADLALTQFARQADLTVLFPFDAVSARTANAVTGSYSVEEGLEVLLEGTGLKPMLKEDGVLSIEVPPEMADERGPGAPDGPGTRRRGIVSMVAALAEGAATTDEVVFAREREEVTVTGTRIERATGFTTAVPVTAVTRSELVELAPASTVTEALDALPQFFSTQTAQRGGHPVLGAGRSTLDMRGMGAKRTLVLIDGARTVPVDRSSRVNVDNIPTALIERVDVVTGGASAAYGADALAGVTNFILDRDFEGLKTDLRVGRTSEGDGRNWNVSVAGGAPFGARDRWHVTCSLESQEIAQIERNAADEDIGGWFRRVGFVQNPDWSPDAPPGVPQRLVVPLVHSTLHTPTGVINEPGFSLDRHAFSLDGQSTSPYVMADIGCYGAAGSSCTINSASGGPWFPIADAAFDDGPFGAEVKRTSTFVGLQFDVSERTQFFGHLLGGETQSNMLDLRGNPHLMGVWHATAFIENPFLPEPVRDAMAAQGFDSIRIDKLGQIRGPGLRNFNDRQDNINAYETWSLALGFDHALFEADNWQLRGQIQRGESDKRSAVLGEARVDRMFLAMDAVRDPGTGQIICNVQRYDPTDEELAAAVEGVRVPAPIGDDSLGAPNELVPIPGPVATIDDTISGCVPLNIFGAGHVSPEAQRYVVGDKYYVGAVTQEFAELLVSGEFADGIGAGPFSVAAGGSYREEMFWQRSLPRALMAFGPPVNAPEIGIRGISSGWAGNRNVHHFSDFPAIKGGFDVTELFAELDLPLLDMDASPSLAANVAWRHSDYSLSGPIDSAKLGLDLGITNSLRLRATFSRDVREPTFSERFDFQGGGGSIRDPVFDGQQFETISVNGGNPNLEPEEAYTRTAGFVYQPESAAGLQAAIDYYEIDLSKAVDQLGLQTIVDRCYETGRLCEQVRRHPETNVVTLVENVFLNVADARVRGVDIELFWNSDVDFFGSRDESLNLRVLAGFLNENSETSAGGAKVHHAGGIDFPELTAIATANYRAGPYRLRLQQRYIDETILNTAWVDGVDVDDNTVESQSITNLTFGYERDLGDGRTWEASLSVNNLFDVEPPVIAEYWDRGGAQAVSNNYDVFGRRFSVDVNYGF